MCPNYYPVIVNETLQDGRENIISMHKLIILHFCLYHILRNLRLFSSPENSENVMNTIRECAFLSKINFYIGLKTHLVWAVLLTIHKLAIIENSDK